ncbi:MAG TPA: hypothetical protein VKZ18_25355 [Polyangia bacterium]|nr:hypothetical protein [Polyangia bacterium]
MATGPKQKSEARDPVTLVVIVGMVGLTLGGIVAIFSAPLWALLGR